MDPVIFSIGPFELRYYGLMYVLGIVGGAWFIREEVIRKDVNIKPDEVLDFAIYCALFSILGSRIYYVLFNLDYYLDYPKEIPAIWHGGLAIHGGLIFGLLFVYLYSKKHKIIMPRLLDCMAPGIIFAQTVGRFGNFMNGDAHGRPTDMPWGVVFPLESIAGREFPNIPIHPAMLYEMFFNFCILMFLWFYLRRREHENGFIILSYLTLYSVGRFIVEHFRADSLMLGPLKMAQVISIVIVILSVTLIYKYRLWKK